jgi:hypothetical protein
VTTYTFNISSADGDTATYGDVIVPKGSSAIPIDEMEEYSIDITGARAAGSLRIWHPSRLREALHSQLGSVNTPPISQTKRT